HFSESAETLLAGTIEAVFQNEPVGNRSLPYVRKVLLDGFENLITYLGRNLNPEGLAHEASGVLVDILGSDEAGSFRTTLSRNLKWLADADMRAHLQSSGFSLRDAMRAQASVFIVVPPDEMHGF